MLGVRWQELIKKQPTTTQRVSGHTDTGTGQYRPWGHCPGRTARQAEVFSASPAPHPRLQAMQLRLALTKQDGAQRETGLQPRNPELPGPPLPSAGRRAEALVRWVEQLAPGLPLVPLVGGPGPHTPSCLPRAGRREPGTWGRVPGVKWGPGTWAPCPTGHPRAEQEQEQVAPVRPLYSGQGGHGAGRGGRRRPQQVGTATRSLCPRRDFQAPSSAPASVG